ncbi:MAG: hypothetical protein ACE5D2_05180 [Fidelibacterota bacterium]
MSLLKSTITFLLWIFLFSFLTAQSKSPIDSIAFLNIESDSANIPIYVDKILIGHTPLNNPIPVIPGYHTVSFIPGEIQNYYSELGLSAAVKQIYVTPGATQKIILITADHQQELVALRKDRYRTTIIGVSMGLFALVLTWLLAV